MNQFDVVEKIPAQRLTQAIFSPTMEPELMLKRAGIIRKEWYATYFNWGRNALYALFKRLPYTTIHFPAFTCPVLTDAALAAGKKVELLEVELETYNLKIGNLPNKDLECLVVVHTFGNPVDIGQIRKRHPKTFIIEDCAHAIFSEVGGKYVGHQGDAILFSLYKQVPNLNGALLLTKERFQLKQETESLISFWPRVIFKTEGWHHLVINFLRHRYIDTLEERAYRDSIQPHPLVKGVFVEGFKQLEKEIAARRQIACWYREELKNHPYLVAQKEAKYGESSYYQLVIRLKPDVAHLRDQVVRSLRQRNIFLDRLWYSAPITEKRFTHYQLSCPQALQLARSVMSLPVNSRMTQREVVTLVRLLTQEIKINL